MATGRISAIEKANYLGWQAPTSAKANLNNPERLISLLTGAWLGYRALRSSGSTTRLLASVASGALLHRGLTGHCAAYAKMGIDTARGESSPGHGVMKSNEGLHIDRSITIARPLEDVYA